MSISYKFKSGSPEGQIDFTNSDISVYRIKFILTNRYKLSSDLIVMNESNEVLTNETYLKPSAYVIIKRVPFKNLWRARWIRNSKKLTDNQKFHKLQSLRLPKPKTKNTSRTGWPKNMKRLVAVRRK